MNSLVRTLPASGRHHEHSFSASRRATIEQRGAPQVPHAGLPDRLAYAAQRSVETDRLRSGRRAPGGRRSSRRASAVAQRLQSGGGTRCYSRRRTWHPAAISEPSATIGSVAQGAERTGRDLGLLRATAAMSQPSTTGVEESRLAARRMTALRSMTPPRSTGKGRPQALSLVHSPVCDQAGPIRLAASLVSAAGLNCRFCPVDKLPVFRRPPRQRALLLLRILSCAGTCRATESAHKRVSDLAEDVGEANVLDDEAVH